MKISFWKVFSFISVIGEWANEALKPDEDGVVRITVKELSDLAVKMCAVFGWTATVVDTIE